MNRLPELGRRDFLKRSASLVFALPATGTLTIWSTSTEAQTRWDEARGVNPEALDTWLAIGEDGNVTAFFGKMDMGQGVDTAIAQVVAEELDVDVNRVSVVMGDTHLTANQGGASGSSGCRIGANALRNAAAEARRVLVARAGDRLTAEPAALAVENGVVSLTANPEQRISYAELIADGFDTGLDWNRQYGNGLDVSGAAVAKSSTNYSIVGQPVARKDISGKILATTQFCHHVTLPEMLHGRGIRPPVANAVPVIVDEASISSIAGARVVWKEDFLAVVAETEWSAVKAARELDVTWSETEPPFPRSDALYDHIRNAPVTADNAVANFGPRRPYDPNIALDAIAAASIRLEADYELPFQSHARMAPSVGVADVKGDEALVFSDTQKSHNTRDGIAKLLGLEPDNVRVIWKPGPGSYGRSDADEAAFEAAVLSQETGRPVRVQWMRHEGHAWDPKAPAAVISMKAGLDPNGAITGWYLRAKGFSGWDVLYNASEPRDTLVGQLLGFEKGDAHNFGVPGESYALPNSVQFWETIPPLMARASPLRTAHMRAPQEPQLHFAQECFLDEIAARTQLDPIALRLTYLTDEREIAVLEAVARLSRWQSRPSPAAVREGDVLRGRGVSITSGFGSSVATVCEVEVERSTGRVWPRRFFVAHDCGLIINPKSLRTTIEGNVVQGISRTLFEEVRFDEHNVLSVDWNSYPILEMADAPESIEIDMIDRPNLPAGGAGEPAHVTIPAAIGNALYDATGVRFRRLPLKRDIIRAGLA